MAFDSRSHNHLPGSPLYGGRTVSSGSHSFLRKLTSFTKRSKSQPLVGSPYTTARPSLPTPPSSPPSSSSSAPSRMALAAAQTASLKATANCGLLTPPSTARPASSARPVSRPKTSAPGTSYSGFMDATPGTCNAPLVVQVEIRFPGLDGLHSTPSYAHEYSSSQEFNVSNRVCKGLLRRLTHCSTELITRRDSKALMQQQRHGHFSSAKRLAYELHFRILRRDSGVWAEKSFCAYQKQVLSSHDAHEVILATHRMVGLFMRRHDPAFRWSDAPTQLAHFAARPEPPELVSHAVGRPLPLSCIPRSRFLEDSQSFEFVPGYAIKLSFRSRCHTRKQYEWKRAISLQSNQSAPLSLSLAEDLLWQTFESVNSALSIRRQAFNDEHSACDSLEGVVSCQHFDEDALDIELKIQNNLGPDYTHLTRSIRSKLALFRHPDGIDCQDFIRNIHSHLAQSREAADVRASSLPDFDYRIVSLKTPAWSLENPARFVLDASTSYSRRSIEAILDRVETGISDVLWHKGCNIHVVAYKRGHLILDKSLVTSPVPTKPALFPKAPATEDADEIIASLKERIHQDINAICKDTCSLDSLDNIDDLRDSAVEARTASPARHSSPSSPPMTPTAEKFENTVVLEESSVADDEPIVPAPRVVELPDDFYLGDSPPSSPTASTRRRAFPLVPEKFIVPPSQGSSSRASTPPIKEETVPEVLAVEMEAVSSPESPASELAEMPAEIPAEILLDITARPPFAAPTETSVETATEMPSVTSTPTEMPVEAAVDALHGIPVEPVLAETITVEEIPEDETLDTELRNECVTPQYSEVDNVAIVVATVEDESSESSHESVHDNDESDDFISLHGDRALASPKPTEKRLPQFILGSDDDSESEAEESPEKQEQNTARDPAPFFYSFDDSEEPASVELRFERDGSPTIGTQLGTILESDDETSSEFELDFPAYDQGIPYVPSDSDKADSTFSETSENESLANFDQPVGSDDELEHVSQPVSEQFEETLADAADDSDGSDSDDEPLSFSTPPRKACDKSLTGLASNPRAGSSDITRPSTPSLSHSSGGFNSPETSFLETPRVSHESRTAIVACFDSDNDTRYGHLYDADGESEPEPPFSRFARDPKPAADDSVAHVIVDSRPPLDNAPIVPISPTSCGVSESDSAPTEVWRGTAEVTTETEVARQHPAPELELEVSESTLVPDTSFEDFAMTKPNLDLDEYTEAAIGELESDEYNDITLVEDLTAETDVDDFQLPDYDGMGPSQEDVKSVSLESSLVQEPDVNELVQNQQQEPLVCPEMVPLPDIDDEIEDRQEDELERAHAAPPAFSHHMALPQSIPLVYSPPNLSEAVEGDLAAFSPHLGILDVFGGVSPALALLPKSKVTMGSLFDHKPVAVFEPAACQSTSAVQAVAETQPVDKLNDFSVPETPSLLSAFDLAEETTHETVDELALYQGSAPSENASVTHDELAVSEVQTHRWSELTDPEIEVSPEHPAPEVDVDTSDTGVAITLLPDAEPESSIGDIARASPTNIEEDASPHHATDESSVPEDAVSDDLSNVLDLPAPFQLTVLPTPPESEDGLEIEEYVDTSSKQADAVAHPTEIHAEGEEDGSRTPEAVSKVADEETATLSPVITSQDMLLSANNTIDLSPKEELESPSTEVPLTAQEASLAPDIFAPELPTLVDEVPHFDSVTPLNVNSIRQTGTVAAKFPAPAASWFLPKAGLVGLDESRLVRVGLRGALTGSRAFDNISSHASDARSQDMQPAFDDDIDVSSADDELAEESLSNESSVYETVEEATPAPQPVAATVTEVKEQPALNNDAALPRVVIAFTSLVVMCQMINRSSSS